MLQPSFPARSIEYLNPLSRQPITSRIIIQCMTDEMILDFCLDYCTKICLPVLKTSVTIEALSVLRDTLYNKLELLSPSLSLYARGGYHAR